MTFAFLSPVPYRLIGANREHTSAPVVKRRWIASNRRKWSACQSRHDEEGASAGSRELKDGSGVSHGFEEKISRTETMDEMDQLAEEWIGSDLGRWEWYERMKARREKMVRIVEESEEKWDEEMGELKRAFVEFDAVFGTNTIDEKSEISMAGWSIVAFIMVLYVVVGYAMCEGVVRICTTLEGAPFPY